MFSNRERQLGRMRSFKLLRSCDQFWVLQNLICGNTTYLVAGEHWVVIRSLDTMVMVSLSRRGCVQLRLRPGRACPVAGFLIDALVFKKLFEEALLFQYFGVLLNFAVKTEYFIGFVVFSFILIFFSPLSSDCSRWRPPDTPLWTRHITTPLLQWYGE